MKKILFLLLFTVSFYGQTYQNPTYGTVKLKTNTATAETSKLVSQQPTTGELNYVNATALPISTATQDALNKKQSLDTGFISGLALSINADPTKVNIASGFYTISDLSNPANPTVTIKTFAGLTGVTPAYLTTANATYIALDVNGNVVSSASPFTDTQRRTLAIIGVAIHSNHTTVNVTNELKAPIVAPVNQLHDFMRAIGSLNQEGNIFSPNGANLQLNKSAGVIFGMGINSVDYLNPHQLTIAAQTAPTFAYRIRGGTQYADTQNIDPNNYDNAGTFTAIPGGSWWTIQRINLFQSGLARIQYGQTLYATFNDAVTALPTEAFVTEQNIADNAIFRCYLIVKKGATDLTADVAADIARFVPVDKFGNVVGNGSVNLTYANIVAALGYTPENVANKKTDLTVIDDIGYPSVKAVTDGLVLKANDADVVHKVDTEGARLDTTLTPIYAWGDSMTSGAGQTPYTSYLSDYTKYTITNKGVGGESSTQIKDRMIAEPANYSKSVIIWAGRNNYTAPATVKADIATMIAALGHTRYLVVGIVNQDTALEYINQSEWIKITQLNADLKVLYGDKFVDIRPYLVSLYNPSIPQDVIDHANDVPPTSLRIDFLHLTSAGNAKVADYINKSLGTMYGYTSYLQSKDFKYYFESNLPLHTIGNETFTGIKTATNTSAGNLNGIALINNGTTGSYSQSITTINSGAGLDFNSTGSSVGELVHFRRNGTLTGYVGYLGNIVGAGIRSTQGLDVKKTRPALSKSSGIFYYNDTDSGTNTQIYSDANGAKNGILFNAYFDNTSAVFPLGIRQTENGNAFGLGGGYFNFTGNGRNFQWGITSSYPNGSGKDVVIGTTELMNLNSSGALSVIGGFLGNLTGTSTSTNAITPAGVSSQYWKGNNVWGDFNSSAISSVLTGYVSGTGTVSSTDSILQSIQKIDGNIALKSPIASPTFTGTPTAPTATAGTNTTQIATTAYVTDAVASPPNAVLLTGNQTKAGNLTMNNASGASATIFLTNSNYSSPSISVANTNTYSGINASNTDSSGKAISTTNSAGNGLYSNPSGSSNATGVFIEQATGTSKGLNIRSNTGNTGLPFIISKDTSTIVATIDREGIVTGTSFVKTGGTSSQFLKADGSVSISAYKVYTALLTQTGTSAPTVKVLENTLGGTVVWTYTSIGVYVGTLTGVFTADKSPVILTSNNSGVTLTGGASASTNFVGIETKVNGTLTDGSMIDSFIEIRVYP